MDVNLPTRGGLKRMANAKRKCKFCKRFFPADIEGHQKHPVGWFHSEKCVRGHVQWVAEKNHKKKIAKARKEQKVKRAKYARRKREFYENDKPTRTKVAQAAFNSFIRERDRFKPCVSCLRKNAGQWDAGHYKSRGAHPELRFEELNCHRQCSVCNDHKSGNIADYRSELIRRIGLDKVEWLEGPHPVRKYTCEGLKQIELYYKRKTKLLKGKNDAEHYQSSLHP